MSTGTIDHIRNTDIYLIDQILKGRYDGGGKILDAGCGGGKNIPWFVLQPHVDVYAIDTDPQVIRHLMQEFPSLKPDQLICSPVQSLPFPGVFFDHIICCAVLHFASSREDFWQMLTELLRVVKPGGSLFIRMASDFGIEGKIVPLGGGRFSLPDGTDRFLLTRPLLQQVLNTLPIWLAEPVKTTNVQDIRCMTTLVIIKST